MKRRVVMTERYPAGQSVGERIKAWDELGSMWIKCEADTTLADAANALIEARRRRGYWARVDLPTMKAVAWVNVPASACTGKEQQDWFWN